MPDPSQLVAHRGFAGEYPENTIEALSRAIELGLDKVEIDVQLTSDGVPVMLHDDDLKRTKEIDRSIFDIHSSELSNDNLESLEQVVEWAQPNPTVTIFVELKGESIKHHGVEACVKAIAETCEPIIDRCVFISFDAPACGLAKPSGFKKMGWVLPSHDDITKKVCMGLNPDYIFCDVTYNADEYWSGDWNWVVYEVVDKNVAQTLIDSGVDLIESKRPNELFD